MCNSSIGYRTFYPTKKQYDKIKAFIKVREDFTKNKKSHRHTKRKFFIFSTTTYDKPPSGLFWCRIRSTGPATLFNHGWYDTLHTVFKVMSVGQPISLSIPTMVTIRNVLLDEGNN